MEYEKGRSWSVSVALGVLGLAGLRPDGVDLFFYLGDLFHVAASFVVRHLGCELVDLLLVLPANRERSDKKRLER